ncbi:MAG: tRNA epoxyqueuosine(34) reductase QueG [Anaerolineaceae bacterium]|nr:tRNA epoxyqueuosine(34) reductase QueG [Anaerolineaceae bacterium]
MPFKEEYLKAEAKNLGFQLSGITNPSPPQHFAEFLQWIQGGYHAEMSYLSRPDTLTKRQDPTRLLESVKSILVLGFPYRPLKRSCPDEKFLSPGISAYAMGSDYHDLIPEKIKLLMKNFQKKTGLQFEWRSFTDSAPVMEHDLAARAGLGWIGKNTLLLNRVLGSYFFLAEVFLSLELEPDQISISDYCGTCTICIDACPTQAIQDNRTIDARKCLSYLTIENKGTIPAECRTSLNESIFGCDICQQVCPWNQNRLEHDPFEPLFVPDSNLQDLSIKEELSLSTHDFKQKYKHSPILRVKRNCYLRNLCVWAGNSNQLELIPILELIYQQEEDALVREHARWALDKLQRVI